MTLGYVIINMMVRLASTVSFHFFVSHVALTPGLSLFFPFVAPFAGYVIINTMVRLASTVGFSIARCLKRFAMARPPGIYKDAYIDDLFR